MFFSANQNDFLCRQFAGVADDHAESRYASLEQDERDDIMENIETKNTKRQNTTAVKLFREYLTAKSKPIEFEQYTVEELDDTLASFYLEMRSKEGKHYKKTTMQSYRQGLNRHIQKCRDIDICNEDILKQSTKSFKGMTKELTRLGLAAFEYHPSIEESDIEKMYSFFCKNLEDAQLLQYNGNFYNSDDKTFNSMHNGLNNALSVYLLTSCCTLVVEGGKTCPILQESIFAVTRGTDDKLYVYKVIDEQTKNNQSDSELSSDGRMYEITGHNRLGQFMNEISKMASLSQVYTNHSCRATTVHLLDEVDIPSRHIVTVTGHKSETSL
ncbi:unnamed protein product [Mytilus coruscus]|uniref:KCTD1_15 n=1 Tax=Mytilus coruscus TaxID=42192 RepID=A0A6J8AA31_MYTCO|nr:unnamed protein product [Mytilus coruscus]